MNKGLFLKGLLLSALFVSLFSCDKDFNTIGSDIVGQNNFVFDKYEFAGVQTGYEATGAVQTNNLPLNSFGVYNNPAFGTTKSSFVTQINVGAYAGTTVGANPAIDSVWLYVPYYSKLKSTDENGNHTYELDSIYGGETKFKLKIYENGYYLGSYDPTATDGIQKHYSNERLSKVEPNKRGTDASGNSIVNGAPLNNGDASENDQFFFDKSEHIIYKTNQAGDFYNSSGTAVANLPVADRVVKDRVPPGMWINLNKDYFLKRILQTSPNNLLNNNVFREYFRGLYFYAEANASGEGALAMLDFSKGYIKIEYNQDTDPVSTTKDYKTMIFNFAGGNTVNFFDNDYNYSVNPNRIALMGGGKGATGNGDGSVAYVDVFGPDADNNGVPDQLEYIKAQGWMINEANLVFYVDRDVMAANANQVEPNRLYLYDSKNNKPIVDFNSDPTTSSISPKFNKYVYGGLLEKENNQGLKYKFRITNYLKSCMKNADSTNFRLRLAVSENINNASNAYLKNPIGTPQVKFIPVTSVISPLGTILHGSGSEIPEKRLKLEIYYTKPD